MIQTNWTERRPEQHVEQGEAQDKKGLLAGQV